MRPFLISLLIPFALFAAALPVTGAEKLHALAMHGAPKYPAGFPHFDYVNPDAPRGGTLRLGRIGSFDSVHPFILKGVKPEGWRNTFQPLMTRSKDEPFTLYANLAETIEIAEDRSWIIFNINPKARFSNGDPVTAEDVLFSYETLRDKGRPNVRTYYKKATEVALTGPLSIKFTFGEEEGRWEMPLIMGLMSVISKAEFESRDFEKTSLSPFIGSGPYIFDKVEPGRRVSYKRNPDFWGWDLPQNKGRHNFDTLIYDYFRDDGVALEAFKAHTLDARFESDAGKWIDAYSARSGSNESFVKTEPKLQIPAPMLAMVFNTRRDKFADRRVRIALTQAFDFEWVNANILQSVYKRTDSFFENSSLASKGPISSAERELLSPFAEELPTDVFDSEFSLPVTDGSGRNRQNLRTARKLLAEAGWEIEDGTLRSTATGEAFTIEFLVNNNDYVKLIAPFQKNLQTLGITTNIRQSDTASYQNRLNDYDFDMIINSWGQSLSPGNEQAFYWSRTAAETPGTRNYPAIRLAAVDEMIALIASAKTREQLENATLALDRMLLWGYYVIPLYHTDSQWFAHWPEIRLPPSPSFWGTSADLWWHEAVD
ncbi:extracellular solute-binding protein [Sneathiella marina]|uniref:Extracellular solute-binding protein n=1 Tax=Sneathiella marina TaxID=2950108 RepID=A0ABY4W2N9_9PROT|nr:extracellular solute-binding protein [Sneathiella marina]USG61109.1 extracellular solute-binding protein [Sneathiella marina]